MRAKEVRKPKVEEYRRKAGIRATICKRAAVIAGGVRAEKREDISFFSLSPSLSSLRKISLFRSRRKRGGRGWCGSETARPRGGGTKRRGGGGEREGRGERREKEGALSSMMLVRVWWISGSPWRIVEVLRAEACVRARVNVRSRSGRVCVPRRAFVCRVSGRRPQRSQLRALNRSGNFLTSCGSLLREEEESRDPESEPS